ncbi:Sir2 family NAD-dependent protein deacetylase [Georgenia subflava]|uniref:NAD-dependent protein deacetylase n=1 Tax=Georgenia subflava TaxID=1622177 RepID=A0A6N7EFX6_9MICO|nr:Sir2 family NAD-dependent protein deacetylase [Georgenia subflava]MPV37029.1 NAD-dependent deacetylase [Georgenia subflava]
MSSADDPPDRPGHGHGHGHHTVAELFPRTHADAPPRFVIKPAPVPPPTTDHPPDPEDVDAALAPVVASLAGRRLAVLTGAGLSTDSGIPDYRSPGAPPRHPMTHQQFVSSAAFRRHYWARNHLGWRHLHAARPNAGHVALAAMEDADLLTGLITQNIDLLHLRAGSRTVVHLHGRYDTVVCLSCGKTVSREEHDAVLVALNPHFGRFEGVADLEVAPDADVVLESTADFEVADCSRCGGILKPDVVFFGDNTPRHRVEAAYALVDDADALLVAGSSLAVMSGLRFVRRAAKAGKPVAIINRGATRGDDLATVRLHAGTTTALPLLAAALTAP